MPTESQIAAILLWVVALGWALPAPVLIWWVIVRGRLPVLPFIGEPNGGPFSRRLSRSAFVVLLGLSLALGVAQASAGSTRSGDGMESTESARPQPVTRDLT